MTSTIIEYGEAFDTPCQEWTRGPLTGSIPHFPLPLGRVGRLVEVGCDRCLKSLYIYREED